MTLRVAFFVFMPVHQHEKRTNATIRKTNGIALSTRIAKCGHVSLGVSCLKYHEKYIFRQQTMWQFTVLNLDWQVLAIHSRVISLLQVQKIVSKNTIQRNIIHIILDVVIHPK